MENIKSDRDGSIFSRLWVIRSLCFVFIFDALFSLFNAVVGRKRLWIQLCWIISENIM